MLLIMQKSLCREAYEFISRCGVFYLLTVCDDFPTGRPFGAVMEYSDKLYLSTGKNKNVYRQISNNSNVCIVALESGTKNWIRVRGKAKECNDADIKARMLFECTKVAKHFSSGDFEEFGLIEVSVITLEIMG